MSKQLIRMVFSTMMLWMAGACMAEPEIALFSFNGFGTFGVVHSSEKRADFTSSIFKPNGAGYSRDWSADVDSLIGGQVTARFTPRLTGVVQIIAEQNADGSYRPHVEWANIKYAFNSDFSIRIGRTVLPAFLYSDSRKVAYTYPWVRPPLEMYRLLPVTSNDGIDLNLRLHSGALTHNLLALIGQKDFDFPGATGHAQARGSWALSHSLEYGALTTRITYQKTYLTIPSVKPIFDGFRQFGPQGMALADQYDIQDKADHVLSVGASYDPGDWFAMAEWGRINTHSFAGKVAAWYASAGYRLENFTPYISYARANPDHLSDPGLSVASLPPFLAGPATALNATLNSILSTKPATRTLSIGTRWDFSKQAALKLQFDHIRIGAGSTGLLTNLQPDFQLGGRVNVVTATMDFVF